MGGWLIPKAFAIWLVILALAFANAALREVVLTPRIGKAPALVLSGVILSLLILAVAYLCLPWLGAQRIITFVAVGLGWLLLTMAFDLGLGWVQGKPVQALFEPYRFKDGNLWPLVLLVTVSAPWLAARIRGWA